MEFDCGKLLKGKSIHVENVGTLRAITVDEIVEIGEKNYYKYINNLCFDIDDLQLTLKQRLFFKEKNIKPYDIIVQQCSGDEEYKNTILTALRFFFNEDVLFIDKFFIFVVGDYNSNNIISYENFEEIVYILKVQNGLTKNDILEENPSDERTKALLEKRKEARKKLAKAKARENDGEEGSEPLTFADLISIICANANGVTHENVWRMNIYIFQNQFQRMKLVEDYDISIRSLLAGASSDEVDVKHYISHL